MNAVLLFREKLSLPGGGLIEMVIWETPFNKNTPDGVRYRKEGLS